MIDHLAVLCRQLPDCNQSSGELRFWQILRHLRGRSRSLTLFAEDLANRHLFSDCAVYPMSMLDEKARDADLAFLEFWYMDQYLPTLRARGTPVIIDSVDIEFLRREREKTVIGVNGDYYHLEKAREIRAYRAADQVWAVSSADAAQIRQLTGDIVVVPNIFTSPESVPGLDERTGICFVGSYNHQPNVDGLRWYREHIWPHVQDVPHTIVGNDAPADIRAMPGFVGGVTASVAYVCAARVSIAPLRYGAGLKGKVLEALACGTPVVTTSIGDEGYAAGGAGAALIADDPHAFAEAIRRLLEDDALWQRMSQRGRALAAHYTPAAVAPIIDAALAAALSKRAALA